HVRALDGTADRSRHIRTVRGRAAIRPGRVGVIMLAFWLSILAIALAGVIYLGAVFAGLAVAAGRMGGRAHIAADPDNHRLGVDDRTQEHYREVARSCARNARITLTLAALTGTVLLITILMR